MINNITMPKAALKGTSIAGGPITSGASKTNIEGIAPARLGDTVAGHGDSPHSNPKIASGSSKVNIEGLPAARVGIDKASCMHGIAGGASKTNIG
jgi:uncharacterized Zn-binding protein involved in type VI secretion|tara:strand:- start:573 stop:857 length:285 start_codon:yes stop_codon:yes gene_type:complete